MSLAPLPVTLVTVEQTQAQRMAPLRRLSK